MRVIIIEDKDARALLDQLKLEQMQGANHMSQYRTEESSREQMVSDIHRAFHYIVTRWLQEQGCKVTR